jgi:hypothetical protein
MIRYKLWLPLVWIVLFLPLQLQASQTIVSLKPTAEVVRGSVLLSDIATVSGSSTSQCDSLRDIVITRSPLPGQKRFVGADFIRIRLRQVGVDTSRLLINGSEDVSVSRKSQTITTKGIKVEIEQQIRKQMPWDDEDVNIRDISLDSKIILPSGKFSYRILPNRNEDYLGKSVFALHFFVNGEFVKKTWVNANISVLAEVVTVVRPLGRHQHIEPDDIALKRRDLAKLPSGTIRNIEDALGNRTKKMIYPNTVLRSNMIVTPPSGETWRPCKNCCQFRADDNYRIRPNEAARA